MMKLEDILKISFAQPGKIDVCRPIEAEVGMHINDDAFLKYNLRYTEIKAYADQFMEKLKPHMEKLFTPLNFKVSMSATTTCWGVVPRMVFTRSQQVAQFDEGEWERLSAAYQQAYKKVAAEMDEPPLHRPDGKTPATARAESRVSVASKDR